MKNILLPIILLSISLNAQDLKTSVEEVLSTNPIVLEKLKNYNVIKEEITNAKAGYYPRLDLSLGMGYEHTNKDTSGSDQSFDYGVYQNSLKYTQNLFNGFETTFQVEQQKHSTASAAYSYIENINSTAYEMVNVYIQVMKNVELLENARANVDINEEIFQKVQKLYNAGLTTLSEVNKIESSLSLAKSNFVVQENTILDVVYTMQRVLGRLPDTDSMSKPILDITLPGSIEEAIQFAIQNNPSLLVTDSNIKMFQSSYKEKKSIYYPQIDIEISQAVNKNLSAIEGNDNRFRAMVYLKYNLFNGFSDKSAIQKSISKIHQEVEVKNILRREVIEGLSLSWGAYEKLTEQLVYLKEYENFSLKTLTLYTKEYDLGRRSLLDLLSAQNDFIGAKSQIINTEYSILFSKYRILDAMGTLVTTVVGDDQIVYANVGLDGHEPKNNDTLPIELDRDNDLIVDDYDICNNSIFGELKDNYGCRIAYEDTELIERYDGFIFDNNETNLSIEGSQRLDNLVTQIKPYGFEYMMFEILGNIVNSDLSEDELLNISKLRAEYVRMRLIKAGALEENIKIYAKSDKAPMYTGGTKDALKMNNRADIIVRKLRK